MCQHSKLKQSMYFKAVLQRDLDVYVGLGLLTKGICGSTKQGMLQFYPSSSSTSSSSSSPALPS